MKISGLFITLTQSQSGCYWKGTKSGNYLECKPEYYLKGINYEESNEEI